MQGVANMRNKGKLYAGYAIFIDDKPHAIFISRDAACAECGHFNTKDVKIDMVEIYYQEKAK